MTLNEIPPIDVLRRYFRVDQHGRLERKFASHGWKLAAKCRPGSSYFTLRFEGKSYVAHRLIWALHNGRAPQGVIDHIDGDKWNNRPENLREATHAQNRWNSASPAGATGFRNVYAVKSGGYRAKVTRDYEIYRSPVFDDPELAELAAVEMKCRLHGEFAYANREAA